MDSIPIFGTVTFFAKKHPGELCGSNGLPLTPNSITIYGRAQILKNLVHPNLCEYLDVIRGQHERIVVVSEYYKESICNLEKPVSLLQIKQIAKDILTALIHLNKLGIVHRNLSPRNILLDNQGNVKLFNYGLYYLTNYGKCVLFPIGDPKYTAPEVYFDKDTNHSGPKVDIWSLGIILTELILNKELWKDLKLGQRLRRILSLINSSGTILERLVNENKCVEQYQQIPFDLKEFITLCLQIDPKDRPLPKELLKHKFLADYNDEVEIGQLDIGFHVGFLQRVSLDNVHIHKVNNKIKPCCITDIQQKQPVGFRKTIQELSTRSLKERYYLWQLAGGDVNSELKKHGLVRSKPSVLTLPNLILLEGTIFGEIRDLSCILDLKVVPLPMESLHQRLSHLSFEAYYPLIETKSNVITNEEMSDGASLPLVIREKNAEYQFHRIVLFHRLLLGYPYKRDSIIKEAARDIPPLYRGDIWAALLNVGGDIEGIYEEIDKETATPTDRQIEVDIPRCHQYNELLSSAEGHRKLKRVLKAWVISHPQYVYWQGLDSLCAPFLFLNFNKEAQAYACLSAFIPKYLHNFFLKDNSAVIQEYLAKFKHLISFHDPELANHLDSINFIPELFAIPWFLTIFSHVFPLHKIFHLWDKLLLGDASFPLFIGLAVLKQLRDTLLCSGFNECILLFSDLPEIDIERCVGNSLETYNNTPRSITFRQHELNENKPSNLELEIHPPLTVADLQTELCPRISGSDLLYLLDVNKYCEKKLLPVDIRSYNEYNIEAIPDSISIPFNTVSLSELQVPNTFEGSKLLDSKGMIIVVIGSGGENFTEFGRWLVQCGFPRVCILHGGIQVLKKSGILSPPSRT